MREISARVDILRGGALYGELAFTEPPRIDANADADIYISMSGTFLYRGDVNWMTDELRPVLTIDGTDTPLATLEIATLQDEYTEQGTHYVQLTCYDRALLVQQTKAEHAIFFEAGTTYLSAVTQLLTAAGIALVIRTDSAAELSTDREWQIGEDYLSIINVLLSEINYEPLWFDASGAAVIQPASDPDPGRISHRYERGKFSILRPGARASLDAFAAPNVFVVLCSNPELEAPLVARAENNNPLSSLSILRRGRRITSVVNVDNTPGQTALNTYAQRLASESMMRSETVTISTGADGAHGRLDVVALDHPDLGGIYAETGWSMTLARGAAVTRTLRRMILV